MSSLLFSLSSEPDPGGPGGTSWPVAKETMVRRSPGVPEEYRAGAGRLAFVQGPRGFSGRAGSVLVAVDGFLTGEQHPDPGRACTAFADEWVRDPAGLKNRAGGSFAACVFDVDRGVVHLLRDRFGVRPLWYAETPGGIVVGSECRILRPFVETPGIQPDALWESIVFRRVSGRNHIVAPFKQVLPGTEVVLSLEAEPVETRFWAMEFENRVEDLAAASAVQKADEVIRASYHDLGVAGEPVAVLLSGGVDSSVLAATAKEECSDVLCVIGRMKGYPESEAERGLSVARSLGLETLVVDVDERHFETDWREMVVRIEEPPRNQNNLVLQQLFRAIPDGLSAVLIGDGAENVFGMGVVSWIQRFEEKKRWTRRLMSNTLEETLASGLRRFDDWWAWRLARLLGNDKATFAAGLSAIEYAPAVLRALWPRLRERVGAVFSTEEGDDGLWAFCDHFLRSSALTYLQSSIIRQERLAAPHGLFPVYPFFASSVVDWGLTLHPRFRYEGRSKPLVREVCDLYLPEEVSNWPKMGFPVPWEDWMDGPLKGAREVLGPDARVREHVPEALLSAVEETGDLEGVWTLSALEVVLEELL